MLHLLPSNFREPDPPVPFRYLRDGDAFSIRPEKRGGNLYWFLRKMRAGKTAVVYLGPAGSLTRELVDNAVLHVSTELQGEWNRRKQVNPAELDRKWAETAVEGELDRIIGLIGDHPHKPDSEYWKCVLRIAGVVKGSGKAHLRPSEILVKLLRFTPHDMKWKLANREKDITYLWGRAMNRAPARYRDEKTN